MGIRLTPGAASTERTDPCTRSGRYETAWTRSALLSAMAEGGLMLRRRSEDVIFAGYVLAVVFPPLGLILGAVVIGHFRRPRAGWQVVAISVIVMLVFVLATGIAVMMAVISAAA